jgi:DNA polymerase (family 10)
MQADLRVVRDVEYPAALQYFTGSKEHNTQLRGRARRLGLRVNEYGVFRVDPNFKEEPGEANRLPVKNERELYRLLSLAEIPPELREGMGELEAAAQGALPELVTLADYRGVLHCHSTWSDGTASIRDMALAARDIHGLEFIAICDHSEVAAYARGVKRGDIARQQAEIDALNADPTLQGIRVLKSCECDVLADGSLDYPNEILASMDLVVASIHSRFNMTGAEMTNRLLKAIENPYTSILGHISGRILLGREGYELDYEQVFRRAAECRTIIEINCDPHRLDLDWRLCRRAKELGVLFAVNPDAHSVEGLTNIQLGIWIARKGWLTKHDIVNCLPLPRFLQRMAAIRKHKGA